MEHLKIDDSLASLQYRDAVADACLAASNRDELVVTDELTTISKNWPSAASPNRAPNSPVSESPTPEPAANNTRKESSAKPQSASTTTTSSTPSTTRQLDVEMRGTTP